MSCCRAGVHWLPIITAIYLPLTFFLTYGIAVAYGHVDAGFPYISDTGTIPPESSIFGQSLAIAAVLCGLCMYIRYVHVRVLERHTKLNKAGLVLGYIAAVGLSIIGNFQETSVHVLHLIGSFLAFVVGVGYMWVTTILSFQVYPVIGSRAIAVVRTVLSVFTTVFAIMAIVGDAFAWVKYTGSGDKMHWHPEDGGYTAHMVSTVSEWLMALTFCSFFLTFAPEFYGLKVHLMTVSDRCDSEEDLRQEAAHIVI